MSWINSIYKDIKEIKSTKKQLREFGLLVGSVLIVLSFFVLKKFVMSALIIGTILVIVGLLNPKYLKIIYYIWMTIAVIMGWWVTRVLLFMFFILGIIPIKLILLLSNQQLLDLKINKRKKSYWIYRQSSNKYDSMLEKQF